MAWARVAREAHLDVKWFGAKSDWDGAAGTDSLSAFRAAIGALAAGSTAWAPLGKTNRLVADGAFELSEGLVLVHTIVLEGTGQNDATTSGGRSSPGTMLVFPSNVHGIRIQGGSPHDYPESSAEKTVLHNLNISCKTLDTTGHGVFSTTTFYAQNVTVQNFANDGFHVAGSYGVDNANGNADESVLRTCVVGGCGRDGFHFVGADASACLIDGCTAVVNRRYGYCDISRMNSYIGCFAQGNGAPGLDPPVGGGTGSDYHSEGTTPHAVGYNSSTYIGCYSEGGDPEAGYHPSEMSGSVDVVGGTLAETSALAWNSTAFVLANGVSTRAPLVYQNRSPNVPKAVAFAAGALSTDPDDHVSMDAFSWSTLDGSGTTDDITMLRYTDQPGAVQHGWWALQNNGYYQQLMRFPTKRTNVRQPAPWFSNGLFLGGNPGGDAQVSFIADTAPPAYQFSGDPLTYEVGDVVWNSAAAPGGPLGRLCTVHGTQSALRPIATTGNLPALSTALTLASATYFAVGQYVTIAGVTGIRQIVALAGTAATLGSAGDNAGALAGVPVDVKMIGTIANGSAELVVDDSSRLVVGQYLTIAGVTGTKKIVALGTPAAVECMTAGNYDFDDGFTLVVRIDGGERQTVTFHTMDFVDIHAATAIEVATLLDAALTRSSTAPTSGNTKVTITSDAKGVASHVQVLGGTANAELGFSLSVADGTAAPIVTLDSVNSDPIATDAIIEFAPAAFALFGTVHTRGEDAGQLSIAMGNDPGDANQTLTDAQVYSASVIKAAGTLGADRTLFFPAPTGDEDSYQRTVRAGVTVHDLLVDVVGGAAPITVAAGMTAIVGFDASGAYRVTADV